MLSLALCAVQTATPAAAAASNGYWLVGLDGGIFSYGSAQFYGSMGNVQLVRPVVGIVAAPDHNGYWLDASDGGVFSFGTTHFYGSIPQLGIHPVGSGPNSLNQPIVGMVPSHDGGGYFMVGADGGVFAFGDAKFEGSCISIGGCTSNANTVVAVMPDGTGNGYWVVTTRGNVYAFGDATNLGQPGDVGNVTSAQATPDGKGYVILEQNGTVYNYGDAPFIGTIQPGGPNASVAATAVFLDAANDGGWVAYANGAVANFGNAPNEGGASSLPLNAIIIAGTGF